MNTNPSSMADVYTDFSGLNQLKAAAGHSNQSVDKQSVNKEVAQQFEALYLQMMLKSMRETVGGGMMDSSATEMAQGLYDQQLALQLSKQGAIGISDLVLKQIDGSKPEPDKKSEHSFSPSAINSIPLTPKKANNIGSLWQYPETASTSAQLKTYQEIKQATPTNEKLADKTNSESFITRLKPAADTAAARLGVDSKAILAIAALETGWGKHVMRSKNGQSSHNLFGIKADERWHKNHVIAKTLEFEGGRMQRKNEPFRVYNSPAESVMDFADFISTNPRYEKALSHAHNPERFVDEIHKAGYATDPDYAKKVKAVMHSIENKTQDSWRLADTR